MEIYSFWISPGSVGNYKLLRASYKSMESMEIIFHSVSCVKKTNQNILIDQTSGLHWQVSQVLMP